MLEWEQHTVGSNCNQHNQPMLVYLPKTELQPGPAEDAKSCTLLWYPAEVAVVPYLSESNDREIKINSEASCSTKNELNSGMV